MSKKKSIDWLKEYWDISVGTRPKKDYEDDLLVGMCLRTFIKVTWYDIRLMGILPQGGNSPVYYCGYFTDGILRNEK